MRALHRFSSCLPLVALVACGEFEYEGFLNQPVPISVVGGQPIARISFGNQTAVQALLDSGSPVSVLQNQAQSRPLPADSPIEGSLLFNLGSQTGALSLLDASQTNVTRFIFKELELLDLPVQPVGLGTPIAVRGVLGHTLLGNFSVHLTYGQSPALMLRDLITDTDAELAEDCDMRRLLIPGGFASERCLAVVRAEAKGGGTLLLGDEELTLPASRVVVPVCLEPAAFDATLEGEPAPTTTSGTPLAALVATGLGISLISQSAFDRIQASRATPFLPSDPTELYLPNGKESVRLISVESLAVVGDATFDLGPCGELARRRRLLLAPRDGFSPLDLGQAGAAMAISPAPVQLAIVADESPIFQGPRQELGSLVANVDLILGGNFLSLFELDLDYPASRAIFQCRSQLAADVCRTVPFCSQEDVPSCPGPEG